ncbi:RPP14 protein, partial [Rhodinocichla rosea]|nr:RPP14 protein [Rhodinocichla rosea]
RGPAGRGMAAAAFERRVLRRAAEHHYLRVRLELPDGGARPNAAQFKQLVVTALRELHGEVGAALPVDVLTYEEKTLSAILRVISSGLVKLWSALTLLGFYQNRRCAFRVLQLFSSCLFFLSPNQTSPFLLALSGNSRELVLD